MARTLAQGNRTDTYDVDVTLNRIRSWTDAITGGPTTTRVNHFSDDGDSPTWTTEG